MYAICGGDVELYSVEYFRVAMEQYSIEYFRWFGRWLQALSVVIHSTMTSLTIYGNVRCGRLLLV